MTNPLPQEVTEASTIHSFGLFALLGDLFVVGKAEPHGHPES